MKKWGILLLAALAGVVVLAGCQNNYLTAADLNGYVKKSDCMACHTSDLSSNSALVAARAGYDSSGHLNGPRVFAADGTREFDGSDANYASGTSCGKCHTAEGFVDWIKNGAPATISGVTNTDPNANSIGTGSYSPPGCFTCHDPHNTGTMALRTPSVGAVNIPVGFPSSGLTNTSSSTVQFPMINADNSDNAGALCANCHQARAGWTTPSLATGKSYVSIASYWGPHHGPQADFFEGVGSSTTAATTTATASYHAGVADTCVGCHKFDASGQAGTSMEVGGHGMYLTANVHGVQKDFYQPCLTCHTYSDKTAVTGVNQASIASTSKSSPMFYSFVGGSTKLSDIKVAEATLLTYFADFTKFYVSTSTGAAAGTDQSYAVVVKPTYDSTLSGTALAASVAAAGAPTIYTGTNAVNNAQHLNWAFNPGSPSVTPTQAQALWNLKLFEEDKSNGIHNPRFAAQLLYDAISTLGLTPPTNWTTRP